MKKKVTAKKVIGKSTENLKKKPETKKIKNFKKSTTSDTSSESKPEKPKITSSDTKSTSRPEKFALKSSKSKQEIEPSKSGTEPRKPAKSESSSSESPEAPIPTKSNCQNCGNFNEVRIILRQCGHIVCLPCVLDHLKHKIIIDGYPRIKCIVKDCNLIIHVNDINAILDEKEPALELYMSVENRRFLQHKQNKHSIYQGLPTKNIKRCPLCKAVYMKEPGCNYVICANNACDTSFCWNCEKPIGHPTTHYTTESPCRLGYTDYKQLLTVVEMVLDVNFIILWVLFPLIYLVAFIYVPVLICFIIPVTMVSDVWRSSHETTEYLIPQEVVFMVVKMIFAFCFGAILAIPISIGSILSGFLLVFLYMVFCFIRTIPCGCSSDRVSAFLCVIRWCGRLFRIGPYATLLDEAREGRKAALSKMEDQKDDFENEEQNDASAHFSTNKEDETVVLASTTSSNNETSSRKPGSETETTKISGSTTKI